MQTVMSKCFIDNTIKILWRFFTYRRNDGSTPKLIFVLCAQPQAFLCWLLHIIRILQVCTLTHTFNMRLYRLLFSSHDLCVCAHTVCIRMCVSRHCTNSFISRIFFFRCTLKIDGIDKSFSSHLLWQVEYHVFMTAKQKIIHFIQFDECFLLCCTGYCLVHVVSLLLTTCQKSLFITLYTCDDLTLHTDLVASGFFFFRFYSRVKRMWRIIFQIDYVYDQTTISHIHKHKFVHILQCHNTNEHERK